MKIVLTNNDIKNLFVNMFKDNTENILLKHEPDGDEETVDLYTYLNLHLYAWKERLVEVEGEYKEYGAWTESLDYSLNQTYGLVETENEEITASQDIDNTTKYGAITFLIPSNKVQNLDYYIMKLRTIYAGKPEKMQSQYGNILTTYILLGAVQYLGEPEMTPFGEVIECKVGFTISYLNECGTYSDIEVKLSLNGDDDDEYLTMPITQATYQNIFTATSVPRFSQANVTGELVSACTFCTTLTFYDFNIALTNALNELFWSIAAYKVDGTEQSIKATNIPIYLKIVTSGHTYVYHLVITNMEKFIINNQPNTTSLSLKTYGKGV